MIEMAPVQLIVYAFDDAALFTPKIIEEVERLQKRGLIRLVDLLYVERTLEGDLVTAEMSGLTDEEAEEFGRLLTAMLGMDDDHALESGVAPVQEPADEIFYGLSTADMEGIIDGIPNGGAAAMVLLEHTWAFDIRNKVRQASGRPIAQGFLTPEMLLLVGEEIRLTQEAAAAVALAKQVRGAALLDALEAIVGAATLDGALVDNATEIISNAARERVTAATSTVRALIDAGFIGEAAAEDAIRTLVESDLIGADSVAEAQQSLRGSNGLSLN